ncbi:MAG: UDP-2,3-diacylglucosamine diphosphatase [Gammaproteobacteria bacterium]
MSREIIFISDLHLALEKTDITRRFLNFLEKRAPRAQALYILGDLFDAWVGDDDPTPPGRSVQKKLKHLTDAGTRVFLQQGNRDFLLGERFCAETGVVLLDDYVLIDLGGVTTLLTHGDLLCTDDVAYQRFREKSRAPAWRRGVLSKPLLLRLLAARWYRLRSHFHKRKKTAEIMDVNQQTVESVMRRHQAARLIHGHTHRPAVHDFQLDGRPVQRFVLDDWKKNHARILCWRGSRYHFENL